MRNPSSGPRRTSTTDRVRSWTIRHRRFLAATGLAAAACLTVYQLTPEPAARTSVVAASADLPAGATLDRHQLTTVQLPPQAVPEGSYRDPTPLLGRRLATPLRRGQVLDDTSLTGPGLLTGTPPGTTAVPLRMSDPSSLRILSPGQLIDVILSPESGPETPRTAGDPGPQVLASQVTVLWIGQGDKSSGSWLGGDESPGLVVVGATPAQSRSLAGVQRQGRLSFVLVR